jgi:hypothetical protein
MLVNDVHSKLNPTRVCRIELPGSAEAVAEIVRETRARGERLSIAGGRHAMGGQQFASGQVLVDGSALTGVTALDADAGPAEVGAGITWPVLSEELERRQPHVSRPWTIVQKQTGRPGSRRRHRRRSRSAAPPRNRSPGPRRHRRNSRTRTVRPPLHCRRYRRRRRQGRR